MGNGNPEPEKLTLPISEVFGPTVQGEGPYAGRSASFIRLGGCNLACTWCDSAYTWDATRFDLRLELVPSTIDEIVGKLPTAPRLVVLTGGEPLLYARRPVFAQLIDRLHQLDAAVHLESNGTIFPPASVLEQLDVVVLSPKLGNAGSHRGVSPGLQAEWIEAAATHEIYLKYVCETEQDVADAVSAADAVGWPSERVWVMPQAADPESLSLRWEGIAATAAEHGVNATSRLHLLAWGSKRGH